MENLKLINETDLKYFRELEKQGKAVILEIDPEVLLNTEIRPKEKQSWGGLEKRLLLLMGEKTEQQFAWKVTDNSYMNVWGINRNE